MRARFAAKEGRCEAIEFVEFVELGMEIWRVEVDGRDIFVRWSKFACSVANINPRNFSLHALPIPPDINCDLRVPQEACRLNDLSL